jgi:hypothetical protein
MPLFNTEEEKSGMLQVLCKYCDAANIKRDELKRECISTIS